jgi:hypothetical protein
MWMVNISPFSKGLAFAAMAELAAERLDQLHGPGEGQ